MKTVGFPDLDPTITELFDFSDIGSWTLDRQVKLLSELERSIRSFRYVRDEIGAVIFEQWPDGEDGTPVPFVAADGCQPLVRETGGARTKWDMDGVLTVLTARLADEVVFNRETGERRPDHEVIREALNVAADLGGLRTEKARPRVTPLKTRGIDPSLFSEFIPGDQQKVRFVE